MAAAVDKGTLLHNHSANHRLPNVKDSQKFSTHRAAVRCLSAGAGRGCGGDPDGTLWSVACGAVALLAGGAVRVVAALP